MIYGPTSQTYISQRLRLHYVDWGNETAPPLILLHGGRDHCRSWDWVAQELRKDWHVIAPDLRGHGDSAWSADGEYSARACVYDFAQLIHQKKLAPVTIVAHSYGGNIALRYAGIYPDNVRKLVAIEGLGPSPTMLKERFGEDVVMVHGQLAPELKDAAMERFARGDAKLLVATTVIEVGVDVPNATLMVIEQAERFGLAQLHQLRGRVGRGSEKSFCVLLHGETLSETAQERLKLMRQTQDGFLLAEEDLRLRGGGELLGTRQSGDSAFNVATLEQITALLPKAHDDARLLIERDGGLEGKRGEAARVLLYLFERDFGVKTLRGG